MFSFTRCSTIFFLLLSLSGAARQRLSEKLFTAPPRYTVLRVGDSLQIDGLAGEKAWEKAAWINDFSNITGLGLAPKGETRAKMLWNDQYLYLYIELKEKNLWATIKQHDVAVYRENALEIFVDPDGDNQHYMEFQINALGTVWDLLLTRPYRNGGWSISDWDIKGLKKAVHLRGSINQPDDRDEGWSVELAFPLKSIALGSGRRLRSGTVWRMNLSRVAWPLEVKDGRYVKKMNTKGVANEPDYWVWAPQGTVNLHMPERWGYLLFADEDGHAAASAEARLDSLDRAQPLVWKVYYLQEAYKRIHGHFAQQLTDLKRAFPLEDIPMDPALAMDVCSTQLWIAYAPYPNKLLIAVNQEGKVFYEWPER